MPVAIQSHWSLHPGRANDEARTRIIISNHDQRRGLPGTLTSSTASSPPGAPLRAASASEPQTRTAGGRRARATPPEAQPGLVRSDSESPPGRLSPADAAATVTVTGAIQVLAWPGVHGAQACGRSRLRAEPPPPGPTAEPGGRGAGPRRPGRRRSLAAGPASGGPGSQSEALARVTSSGRAPAPARANRT